MAGTRNHAGGADGDPVAEPETIGHRPRQRADGIVAALANRGLRHLWLAELPQQTTLNASWFAALLAIAQETQSTQRTSLVGLVADRALQGAVYPPVGRRG